MFPPGVPTTYQYSAEIKNGWTDSKLDASGFKIRALLHIQKDSSIQNSYMLWLTNFQHSMFYQLNISKTVTEDQSIPVSALIIQSPFMAVYDHNNVVGVKLFI